jgi:CRISPR-associated protein Cmr4
MYKQENSEIMSLYAVSPVHAGTGSSMGVVDLPIQRERHTNWPHIQSSGVKGAMRHHFDFFKHNIQVDDPSQIDMITEKIFGSENFNGDSLPGAIAVSDAKLLAFPVRSSHKPFIWVTSPAVLKRLEKDLRLTGRHEPISYTAPEKGKAFALCGDLTGPTLLEDYSLDVTPGEPLTGIYQKLFEKTDTLVLVHDDIYDYAVSQCIEVQTQIKIDSDKGVTKDGSLRYQEVLPSDSLMYCILFYGASRNSENQIQTETLIRHLKKEVINTHIQIGGDETLGRGLFEIEWLGKEN